MDNRIYYSQSLAKAITKSSSKQTYYTIRYLVDRELVNQAYLAYGYFRWVDDILDTDTANERSTSEVEVAAKSAFVDRQKALIEAYYRGETPGGLTAEERMLSDLVHSDPDVSPGLQSYLRNMMAVMEFDVERRGRLISQAELSEYSRLLATAVTDAIYYFIGHNDSVPQDERRYLAITAAHITHMLRDTKEDIDNLYFNVPREYLDAHDISQSDIESNAYRDWVCSRVNLARKYFKEGRKSIAQVKNFRCRLAGYAYTARFEWILHTLEKENYCLRSEYRERKSFWTGLWMGWRVLTSMIASIWIQGKLNTPQ